MRLYLLRLNVVGRSLNWMNGMKRVLALDARWVFRKGLKKKKKRRRRRRRREKRERERNILYFIFLYFCNL